MDLDEIISNLEQDMYPNIAQQGSAKCFAVSDDYVLVVRKLGTDSTLDFEDALKNFSKKNNAKCIYTVIDYKIIGNIVYEIQKRAKGEHFRIDETKKTTLDLIEAQKRSIAKSPDAIKKIFEKQIKKYEDYTKTEKYKNLLDTPKDELLRRFAILQKMPNQHIIDLFKSVLTLHKNNLNFDSSGNNVLYDTEKGFAIIDLQCSNKPYVTIENMLDSNNYQTILILLGVDRLSQVHEDDKTEIIKKMRESLKKICVAVFNFEYNGKVINRNIMEQSLATYRQYGIELTYDEIQETIEKNIEAKIITPENAIKSALIRTSTPKANEANGVEQSALNPENIKEGETKDD